jgi:AcrR family transcriptional regulator
VDTKGKAQKDMKGRAQTDTKGRSQTDTKSRTPADMKGKSPVGAKRGTPADTKGRATDRRVKYTKMALRASLIALLKEKSIDKISIKEICEHADVNRSTFYKHYGDQYDLLRQIEADLLANINDLLTDYNFKEYEAGSNRIMERIFAYIAENADLCKVILGEHGDVAFQKELMTFVQRQSMEEWQWDDRAVGEEKWEYYLCFSLNGGIGIVQKWLMGNLQKSAREIADLMIALTYKGMSGIIE